MSPQQFTHCIDQVTNKIPNGPAQKRARHQVSLPYSSTALPSPSFPTRPESSILMECRSEGPLTQALTAEKHAYRLAGQNLNNGCRCNVISIDMLPDDVLLAIFYFCFCKDEAPLTKQGIEAWQLLVHVCRRWRSVVLGSPRRLNLQLRCTTKTQARDMLDVWPALPLVIEDSVFPAEGVDNIVAALECRDRVDKIELFDVNSSALEKASVAMQKPFPELTLLVLRTKDKTVPVIPDSFLGRSTPRLQLLSFDHIPFPGLPKLLLSASRLVTLRLDDIPHSGYISPEAMATALSTLTNLEQFWLGFQSPRSLPDWTTRRPPPPTRSVLRALTHFWFKGVGEYLDDFVSRIDSPLLDSLVITFFNQIAFHTPQFIQFISRSPTLKALEEARVVFEDGAARVNISSQIHGYRELNVKIPCGELDWQVSSLEQVCTSCLPPLSTLEDLYIYQSPFSQPDWQDNIENALWLELLHPFTTVKNLYLCEKFAPRIVPALKELVGGRTGEVLPALQNIFLEGHQPSGPVREGIGQFVDMRQATSLPIAVSRWENSELYKPVV